MPANLEKAIKKNARIITALIVVVALLLVYTILIWGDVSSAKSKARNRNAEEIAAIETTLADIEADTAKSIENIAKYQAEVDEYQAIIDAIKDGTYVAE